LERVVKELWQMPQREYHHFAVELFAAHKKLWNKSSIKLIEYCITHQSWWDTVDFIANEWTGPYFKLFPQQTAPVHANGISRIIMATAQQPVIPETYKIDWNTELFSKYITHLANSKEFFVQKAIGWMLREYGKVNPKWVKEFVKKNELAPLSKREALKNL